MNDYKPTHLDLFSGIGGFSLAFEAEGFKTIAFVENNREASKVLADKWPGVPNLKDVTKLCRRCYDCESYESDEDGEIIWCKRCNADFGDCECVGTDAFLDEHGTPDVITGGVPCQPASAIGQMRGTADERWLWPDTIRIMRELMPRYALFENPPSVLSVDGGRAWNGIVSELAALGYDMQWDVVPAAAIGAGHLRERIFLLCSDSDGARLERHARNEQRSREAWKCGAEQNRPTSTPDLRRLQIDTPAWYKAQSPVLPLANGIPSRLAECAIRCAGNAVVPQVAQIFARAIRQQF